MPKNFFITGEKSSGKTFLVNSIIKSLDEEISGFKTVPYAIENKIMGHYFHSFVSVENIENNLPITIRHTPSSCIKIADVFTLLGVPCLDNSLKDKSRIIVMDEIGTIEADCIEFLDKITLALDSEKIVLATIKKSNAHHISKILSHKDSILVDLDESSREFAFGMLITKFKEALK